MAELTISSDEIRSAIANYTSSYSPEASREEVGVVISAADGIAQVSGLPSVMWCWVTTRLLKRATK